MEETGFDDMAKAFGSRTTRRLTLGALLGGALGHLGLADAEGKKRKKSKKSKQTETTKPWCHCPDDNPTNCVTLELTKKARQRHQQKDPFDTPGPCEEPFTCPAGQTNCAGVCQNLQTDETNCGTCGTSCGAVQGCCSGVCTNLNTDEANCGTCGHACAVGQTCCYGVCKNLQADPTNCGTCGTVCAAPAVICLAGDCCKPPSLACAAAGADATCCSGVCLPAGVGGIPFPHCA
jgi:Stigma-specific protein, Stig1